MARVVAQGSTKITADLVARYEADVTGMEGKEHLQQVCDGAVVQLVLHGHHHETGRPFSWPTQGGGSAWVLSTGSWGLKVQELPGSERASCQLLRLRLSDEPRVWPHRLEYDPQFSLRGDVEPGHFKPSATSSHNEGLKIELPAEFKPPSVKSSVSTTSLPADLADFVDVYRAAMSGFGGDWDLRPIGTAQGGGVGKPVVAKLDDMYLPLRLDAAFDSNKTDAGKILNHEAILARRRVTSFGEAKPDVLRDKRREQEREPKQENGVYQPIAIRAAAGCGKTTWMRYTFRTLLRDRRAIPLMIVLRDVAAYWLDKKLHGAERSIFHFLDHSVAEMLGRGHYGRIQQLLDVGRRSEYSGPRFVLLVDGWDELGDLGREFREKLDGISEALRARADRRQQPAVWRSATDERGRL